MGIAGAIVGAAVIGGVAKSVGAHNAANAQVHAADQANSLQSAQYAQTRNDLNPYNMAGQGALNSLTNALGTTHPNSQPYGQQSMYGGFQGDGSGHTAYGGYGQAGQYGRDGGQFGGSFGNQSEGRYIPDVQVPYYGQEQGAPPQQSSGGLPNGYLSQPFNMTQANLEQTPGYQFTLSQGLKSVNNALGARGLLNSGAVLKGGAEYATGLADNTYTNQFNMDQTQKQNIFNRLLGTAILGENAAAQTGSFGTQTAASMAQNTIGAGNAQAASSLAQGNAIGGIGSSIVGGLFTNRLLQQQNAGGSIYGHGG